MTAIIHVPLGESSYDIHVGANLIAQAGELIAPYTSSRLVIVTDENVASAHLESLLRSVRAMRLDPKTVVLPPGEDSKAFVPLERLIHSLLSYELDRQSLVVALGGGVVGDLAGFAAAILNRGIDWIQVPTTLLAQVDSAVGGKTGINVHEGKNLIGAFHQPRVVIADTETLKTLPRRELLAGYAEIVKYAVLGDAGFFSWLEQHGAQSVALDGPALEHAVAHSCKMKAEIVARDEREVGERALLNLGHTFGHALEAETDFSGRLLHGEGVAIGMVLALSLSARLSYCPDQAVDRVRHHLRAVGLPVSIKDIPGPPLDPQAVIRHMSHDKKMRNGRLSFVLVKDIGQAFLTQDVPLDSVRELLTT